MKYEGHTFYCYCYLLDGNQIIFGLYKSRDVLNSFCFIRGCVSDSISSRPLDNSGLILLTF